jgi:hypothetical protein
MPHLHPRELECNKARHDITKAILDAVEKYGLTTAEQLRIVNAVSFEWIGGIAKYAIREERHGNTETPGGLESDDHG